MMHEEEVACCRSAIEVAGDHAPTPTMPNWPRLMWPPQPVSTTSDTPTIAHTMAKPRRAGCSRDHPFGDADEQRRRPASRTPAFAPPHLGQVAQLHRIGLTMPVADHDDVRPTPGPDSLPRCSKQRTEDHDEVHDVRRTTASPVLFHRTICSMMPSPMPAPNATGSDSMRATTAAASTGQQHGRTVGDAPGFTPANGALRMYVNVASPPAISPHDRRQAPHGDAEQQGAVRVLRRGADGDARVGPQQEPGQAGDHERHDGHDQDLVARERVTTSMLK